MASDDLSGHELERAADILRSAGMQVELEDDEKRVLWEKPRGPAPVAERHRAHPTADRRAAHGSRVASAHGAGAHRGVRRRHRRRSQDDALGSVGVDRGDGPRAHDLRPRVTSWPASGIELDAIAGSVVRAGHRLGVPLPGPRQARRRSRSAVTSAETPVAVAFVPARSGSERVPGKNVRPLAGHPLLAYAIETALQSGVFDRVVVLDRHREDRRDRPLVRRRGSVPASGRVRHRRPRPTSSGSRFTLERLGEHYDLFAIVRATNPFRGPDVVRRGLEQLLATPEADSLRAVERVKQHPGKMWLLAEDGRTMSPLLDQSHLERAWHAGQYQALPAVYVQTSALEIAWTRVVSETGTREGRVVAPFFTEGHEGFNVDDEEDWAARRAPARVRGGLGTPGRPRAVSSCGMRVASLETLFCDAGWRPWIFLKATTDDGARRLGGDHGLARLPARPGRDRRGSRAASSSVATRAPSSGSSGISTGTRGRAPDPWSRKRLPGSRTRFSTSRRRRSAFPCTSSSADRRARRSTLYWSHCGTTRARAWEVTGTRKLASYDDVAALGREVVEREYRAFKTNVVVPGEEPQVLMPGFGEGRGTLSRG